MVCMGEVHDSSRGRIRLAGENGDGERGRQGCASWGHGKQEGGRRAGDERDGDEMR